MTTHDRRSPKHAGRRASLAARQAALPVIAVGAIVFTAAACGSASSPPSSQSTSSTSAPATTAPSHSTGDAMMDTVGADCSMIPTSGMGSAHTMSMEPVVVAASHNPLISTFASEAATAGLTSELDAMGAITVFAPSNTAFMHVSSSSMAMMHSKMELAGILKSHVVHGHITPAELATGDSLVTLEGSKITPAKMGSVYEIDSADVICGNITTANATVYIINKVLAPMTH